MHLLLTDETNLPSAPAARFLAYCGPFFPLDRLPALDRPVEQMRAGTDTRPATS